MSSPQESLRRCSHCGRPVRPTIHTRERWTVDCYLLHTGDVEPAILRDEDGHALEYMRLVRAALVVTCSDCYARPEIRAERLFPQEFED